MSVATAVTPSTTEKSGGTHLGQVVNVVVHANAQLSANRQQLEQQPECVGGGMTSVLLAQALVKGVACSGH